MSNPNRNKGEIYVAGPINGVKNWKGPFRKAQKKLEAEGWEVTTPLDFSFDNPRAGYAAEVHWVAEMADAVYMLKKWETSPGAQGEWAVARAVRIKIIYE